MVILQRQVLGMWLVVVVVVVDRHRHSSPTATPSICKMVSAEKQEPRDLCLFCVNFKNVYNTHRPLYAIC